jgi:hypothetical protein
MAAGLGMIDPPFFYGDQADSLMRIKKYLKYNKLNIFSNLAAKRLASWAANPARPVFLSITHGPLRSGSQISDNILQF